MPKLSLAKLERHLYSAADRLRQEGLDAATYKDYIFGMLFLKRCSKLKDIKDGKIDTSDLLLTDPSDRRSVPSLSRFSRRLTVHHSRHCCEDGLAGRVLVPEGIAVGS